MGPTAPAREAANLAFVERWVELHNTDPLRMVEECHAPDAVIEVPGVERFGVERLRALEVSGPPPRTGCCGPSRRERSWWWKVPQRRCRTASPVRRCGGAWCSPSAME